MNMKKNKSVLEKLEKIFFKVTKEDASDYAKKLKFANNRTHFIIAHTPEGPLVVNSCSKDYELIPNKELVMPVLRRLEESYSVDVKVRMYNYAKFYIDYLILDHAMNVLGMSKPKKDMILPRIRQNNSYDGYLKYSYQFGFYRVICENGATIPLEGTKTFNNKFLHTPAAGNDSALNETLGAMDEFINSAPQLIKRYDPLIKARVKSVEEAGKIIKTTIEETDFPQRQTEQVFAALQQEVSRGYDLNLWLIYNAMNSALYNAETKQVDHKRDKVDLEVITHLLQAA